MGIVEQVAAAEASERTVAWKRYFELLAATSTGEKELTEMKLLMQKLRRNAKQVEDDARVVSQAVDHMSTIRTHGGLEEAVQQASKAVTENHPVMVAKVEAIQAEHRKLVAAASNLGNRQSNAQHCGRELQKLKELHPAMLAHVTVPGQDAIAAAPNGGLPESSSKK